jgi:DNA gyrase subunit A
MAKKTKQVIYDEQIIENSMEDTMHQAYMTYAEYVILERALPRVEDGLKPVQRRILYTMSELGLTPDKPYKKSARIVGECLGKYHPHGDTSVYDAMVRLAQPYSMREPMVDGHGNFGSMDGDSAAAMRYTEARLSPLAMEMLRDLGKDTVPFRPNFDDSEWEPDMLPARFPNLLVNGASGIAVGLATNIPPHNLGEVIDGVVYRLDNPECSLHSIMKYIKAPDFPTGGYIVNHEELVTAYETGRGKILLRAKAEIEKSENGKMRIVVTEVPYEIKKSTMLEKILAVSEVKKDIFACIDDIRDESDREGVRAVIEIKKGYDPQKILNLLYKYTDLQVTFGINMMAIARGVPMQLGLLAILDYYIAHQKDVVTRRTQYDLEKAEKREHILAGLIIAVENIDRVIKIIRESKDVREAKASLMAAFSLTGIQAQAILDMRLARLTALEIDTLRAEYKEVVTLIAYLNTILESPQKLIEVIKEELHEIRHKYANKRRTHVIQVDVAAEEPDESEFRVVEECAIVLSQSMHLKRLSTKALQKGLENGGDDKNEPRLLVSSDTDSKIYIFTNKGNQYILPASSIPEGKLKDTGKPLTALMPGVDADEKILNLFDFKSFEGKMLFATRNGMVKATDLSEFDAKKSKIMACGLKEGDELLYVQTWQDVPNMLFITKLGMSINVSKLEISQMGRAAKGVGAINLKKGDSVVLAVQVDNNGGMVLSMTEKGYAKQTPLSEYELQGRNGKGLKTYNLTGQIGQTVAGAVFLDKPCMLVTKQKSGDITTLKSDDIPSDARNAKGEQVVLAVMGNDVVSLEKKIFE